jgi:hypothetical protein
MDKDAREMERLRDIMSRHSVRVPDGVLEDILRWKTYSQSS